MRWNSIAGCVVVCAALSPCGWGEASCPAVVRSEVEISSAEYSLADLLGPDACPALSRAAARMRLGRSPLAGSPRVFVGEELRTQLDKIMRRDPGLRGGSVQVPERVIVRAAGERISCGEIWRQLAGLSSNESYALACGGAERVARNAGFEIVRRSWDPAQENWNVVARCRRPGDCVPFLLRVRGAAASKVGMERLKPERRAARAALDAAGPREMVVRPGQRAILLWEQNGIRLTIPVICLDGGAKGETVQARVRSGGRTLRAVVVDAETLRVGS